MKILFLCVANSARSQMAEGLARKIFGDRAEIESAGSTPKFVSPFAIRAMNEVGIDISTHRSKSIGQLEKRNPGFVEDVDFVITLCGEEICPVLPSRKAAKLHWPFPDPADSSYSGEEKMRRFRETRELIQDRIEEFARKVSVSSQTLDLSR